MRTNSFAFTSFLFILNTINIVSAQPNSVELKDGGGVLISQHNSITQAYAAIPSTLTHTFIIELTTVYDASQETFPVVFNLKSGGSPSNLIHLQPAAGVSAMTISSNQSGGNVLQLDDADYIVIDGRAGGVGNIPVLTLNNTGTTTNSNTIQLINGASHNVIRYCIIENGTTILSGRGISFGTSIANLSGNSDNLVEFCKLNSGRYKITTNGTVANPNTRLTVYGCDLIDPIFVGFWYQSGTGKVTIDSCRIFSNNPSGDGPYGILFDAQADSVFVTRNTIFSINNGTNSTPVKGISIRSVSSTTASYSFIDNNFIDLSAPNSNSTSVMGIEYLGTNATTTRFLFNTVRIRGTLSSGGISGNIVSACLFKTASNSMNDFDIRNNILINERTGGISGSQHFAAAYTDSSMIFLLDYNTYKSTSGLLTRVGNSAFSNMASYQTAIGPFKEVHSNDSMPQFVTLTDLHLAGTSLGNVTFAGISIAGYDVDIDNDPRSSIPYRGADEALPSLDQVGIPSITENHNFSIYPNPVTDHFRILCNEKNQQLSKLQIIDVTGKICFSAEIDFKTKAEYLLSAKALALHSGFYFISIFSDNFNMKGKMIVD